MVPRHCQGMDSWLILPALRGYLCGDLTMYHGKIQRLQPPDFHWNPRILAYVSAFGNRVYSWTRGRNVFLAEFLPPIPQSISSFCGRGGRYGRLAVGLSFFEFQSNIGDFAGWPNRQAQSRIKFTRYYGMNPHGCGPIASRANLKENYLETSFRTALRVACRVNSSVALGTFVMKGSMSHARPVGMSRVRVTT